MLGASSESMKSQHKRAGKFKPTLRSIVENVDFSDSDLSDISIDAEISIRNSHNFTTLNSPTGVLSPLAFNTTKKGALSPTSK